MNAQGALNQRKHALTSFKVADVGERVPLQDHIKRSAALLLNLTAETNTNHNIDQTVQLKVQPESETAKRDTSSTSTHLYVSGRTLRATLLVRSNGSSMYRAGYGSVSERERDRPDTSSSARLAKLPLRTDTTMVLASKVPECASIPSGSSREKVQGGLACDRTNRARTFPAVHLEEAQE